MDKLKGKWHKAANGYDSYEFFEGESHLVPQLALLIEKSFSFTPHTFLVIPLDGHLLITYEHFILGWDNWSGLYLFANSEEGNRVLHDISTEIESFVNNLVDAKAKGDGGSVV